MNFLRKLFGFESAAPQTIEEATQKVVDTVHSFGVSVIMAVRYSIGSPDSGCWEVYVKGLVPGKAVSLDVMFSFSDWIEEIRISIQGHHIGGCGNPPSVWSLFSKPNFPMLRRTPYGREFLTPDHGYFNLMHYGGGNESLSYGKMTSEIQRFFGDFLRLYGNRMKEEFPHGPKLATTCLMMNVEGFVFEKGVEVGCFVTSSRKAPSRA